MYWDDMVVYQKVTRVGWILLLVLGAAGGLTAMGLAIAHSPAGVVTIRAEQCLDAGGRIVKIDGYKGCFELTLVPDSILDTGFFKGGKRQKCAKILDAEVVKIDGYENCFYFERIKLEAENEEL